MDAGGFRRRLACQRVGDGWSQRQVAAFLGVHPVALAVARRLAFRAEESNARDALAQLPAARAETALLPMLNPEDPIGLLTVAEMLERVGGPRTLTALAALAQSADSPMVRDELTRHADAVRARLGAK